MKLATGKLTTGLIFLLLCTQAIAVERPNVVLIYTDDQGYGDASCLNPEAKFSTPNLDRLAAEGITFTNAHCADTVCTPSRYALLTGRYCWRTKMKTGVLGAEAECLIADGRTTLATMLRDAGYTTGMFGKWHLGMDFPGEVGSRDWTKPVLDMPLDKGFDHFFGIPASLNYGVLAWFEGRYAQVPPTLYTAKKPNDRHVDYRIMPPYEATPEQTKRELSKEGMEVAEDFLDNQCLTRFTDEAIDWMAGQIDDSENQKPFFVYLPLTSPHYPVCPLPEFQGQGDCGAYGEFVIETDHHVGRILEFLQQSGIDDNTLIVFTSDNGPENSWKQRVKEFGHRSNGPFRGGKREIYEGGHRVPMFVRWPKGIVQPGVTWDRLVCQTDVMSTLAELLEIELPLLAAEDSHSFGSVLVNPVASYSRPPLISHSVNGRFAITDGDWKLIMPHKSEKLELYNLAADPSETSNVATANSAKVTELTRRITAIVCGGSTETHPSTANDTGYWDDLAWLTPAEYQQWNNK